MIPFESFGSLQELCLATARELAEGKVIGWFQGGMEFGPRALGNRSILADPRLPHMRDHLNEVIKYRESFRPFAPVILAEDAATLFEIPVGATCDYMSFVVRSRGPLEEMQSRFPAVIHCDGTARVQVVDATNQPLLHALLQAYRELTACPMLVNTSFNVRGEPIVCHPEDAYRCFLGTDLDVLVMGSYIIRKNTGMTRSAGMSALQYRHAFTKD